MNKNNDKNEQESVSTLGNRYERFLARHPDLENDELHDLQRLVPTTAEVEAADEILVLALQKAEEPPLSDAEFERRVNELADSFKKEELGRGKR